MFDEADELAQPCRCVTMAGKRFGRSEGISVFKAKLSVEARYLTWYY